ncbi:VOC family protein [Aliifodinibius sp. S!AR15-10]|uniref:VOC family protein n=1 Tax=Aliifodinibius sp. S!AR15-10 TaxID=2950437 RepID=UPI00285F47BA|nr:VOC family protein [Aliifodinibius sp. S!AR15-10]MDR8393736.1 VOC family protein [Aliifodinibius sp. S!AR15-10]
MTKELWINLPVKDVKKSKAFFSEIGFSFNEDRETEEMAAMMVGEKEVPVMLFHEDTFKNFIQHEVTDTEKSSETIISFDAESREEVDQLAEKVKAAGGNVFSEPAEVQGWMYGCAFTDLDGHRWNVLYMNSN